MKYINIYLRAKKLKFYKIFNFIKFLFPKFLNVTTVLFLRKSNTFIKSKYSKNRQWSKSIVYFGLWFGVISAFIITYYTYRFLFVFSYMWWIPALLTLFTLIAYLIKHKNNLNLNFLKIWV